MPEEQKCSRILLRLGRSWYVLCNLVVIMLIDRRFPQWDGKIFRKGTVEVNAGLKAGYADVAGDETQEVRHLWWSVKRI